MNQLVPTRLTRRARRAAAATLIAMGVLAFSLGGAAQAATGAADDDTFVMITSGPEQTVASTGDVTLAFSYDLRPGVDRNGQDAVLESYVVTSSGDWIHFPAPDGADVVKVEGPGTFTSTISLAPGTYTRHIQSSYPVQCDCYDAKDIATPYSFTVPETTGPTPAPTPTVTPTATPTPDPTPTASPTETPVPSPTPEPTTTSSPVPSPTDGAESASASLSSSTVTLGGKLTVTGRGYAPGEAIEVWLHSTPVKLWSGTAGTDGTFSQSVVIPDSTVPGEHHIEVRGATSGVSSLRLTVLGGLAVTGMDTYATVAGGVVGTLLVAAGVGLIMRRRTSGA